jgi:hypothetical protein
MTHTTKDRIAEESAGFSINELPTVAGAIPPTLADQLRSVSYTTLPELARLPRPRERCHITGASRSWLIEQNNAMPSQERFLFSVRKRGKMRGAVFINVAKLVAFMQKAQSEHVVDAE